MDIAVIGGGFIEWEVAENLRSGRGKCYTYRSPDQVMSPFDYDMAQILHKEILDHGINLILNDAKL